MKATTKRYLKFFLAEAQSGKDYRHLLRKVSSRFLLDQAEISTIIRALPYGQFLRTVYWTTIAQEVKRRARHRCSKCRGYFTFLDVHHQHYRYHGFEHLKYRDKTFLQALCRSCHKSLKGATSEKATRPVRVRG